MAPDIQTIKEAADLPAIFEAVTGHPATSSHMYHCPVCGSGDGPNRTPAVSIDPERGGQSWHCFSCGRGGDVLDLAGYVLGTEDMAEKKRQAMEWAGIAEPTAPYRRPSTRARADEGPAAPDESSRTLARERLRVESARACLDDPEAVSYLASRGIDLADARRLGLGYDARSRRLVIPFPGTDGYHTDRAVSAGAEPRYLKPRGIRQPLWNPAALDGSTIVVVEGPLDAVALDLAGYGAGAVALAGTAWRPLVDELRARQWTGTVLVALDADDAGRSAQADLTDALRDAGISAAGIEPWASLGCKDAAEAWAKGPDAMRAAVASAVSDGASRASEERERLASEAYEAALERLHVVPAFRALGNVYLLTDATDPVPTGIDPVDAVLGGGLGAGLYVLGATSSLGKTTLVGQIADGVAASGRPVVFVTLEQSAEEMAAKSLSRTMASMGGPYGEPVEQSAHNLMTPSWRMGPRCTLEVQAAMRAACESYAEAVGDRLRYVVADDEPGVSDVARVARHVAEHEGQAPLVVIDYLQILRAPDGCISDKQATDRNVSALRRLARDLRTPVLAISSLNRASYSGAVTMEAFKESGAIEYGADVLMGLQPRSMGSNLDGMGEKEAAREGRRLVNEARLSPVRPVELTVLKNRWGRVTGYADGVPLTFHAVTNLFEPDRATQADSAAR